MQRRNDCFESVDPQGLAAMYTPDAALIAMPYGTFRCNRTIAEFWDDLTGDGYNDLAFLHREMTVVDHTTVHCTGVWTMNKAYGRLVRQIWNIGSDGTASMADEHLEVLGSITGGPPERAAVEARLRHDMLGANHEQV